MMLSIVMPAFNEESNIADILVQVTAALDDSSCHDLQWEIIVVDDHSADRTFNIIEDLNDRRIRCIRLSRNSGSHTALRAGLAVAAGDAALCMAADGQDDPQAIPDMVRKWRDGAQLVFAMRKNRNDESLSQRVLAKSFYWLLNSLHGGQKTSLDLSRIDFFLLDRKVVDSINDCAETNTSLFGLIMWLGFRQDYIEYERKERLAGKSHWRLSSRIRLAIDWITAFSGLPLKLIAILGLSMAVAGAIYAIVIFVHFYSGNPIAGWSSVMVTILIIGGIQMTMLGIIGEYIWRSISEARHRPLYFVENDSQSTKSLGENPAHLQKNYEHNR